MLRSKKIRDRAVVVIGATLPLAGTVWETSIGLKTGKISLFGNNAFSRPHEAGFYWFTILLYATISVVLIAAIIFVLSGKNDAAEKLSQSPEPMPLKRHGPS